MTLSAGQLRQLSALLDECTGLPPPVQAAYLAGLTGDAALLRPWLARALAREAAQALDGFLSQPPEVQVAAGERPAGDFSAGDRIGPYELIKPVGRGGMGEVWLAARSDGQLKRSVALKLPVLSARRSVLVQRFERERDILAALIHPHIARLYDAGVADDGQPYMALEYVAGTPITQAAEARLLDAAGRLRLLRQVMDAVQYAHANLVIHRDLKPGNVLVTEAGEAKLLDFGIAKLLEDEAGGGAGDSELTRIGGRALTLRYAAPELIAGGAVGTAADVWALGVLLYELLTGLRPFEGEAAGVVEQHILGREPLRPSQRGAGAITRLSRSRAGDLDTIVLKALKKAPAERYVSVGAFADDLDRWLRGQPVRAQRDSRWYRTRRFIGRNRLAVVATSLAGAALVGVTSMAVVLGLQAREESARARAARDFMVDIFLQTDRDLSPGQEVTGRQLLSGGYRAVVATMQEQPLLQAELLLGIGDALDFMEELVPADEALDQATRAYERAGRRAEAAHAVLARAAMRQYNRWDVPGSAALMARAFALHPDPEHDDAFMARYAIYRAEAAEMDGDAAAEKAWYLRAGPPADRSFKDNSTRTVMALRTLARLDGKHGAQAQGVERLNGLLARLMSDKRARPAWIVGVLNNLGEIEFSAGRYRVALEKYDAEDDYCRRASDPRGIQCIYTQHQRAITMLLLGHTERALKTVPLLLDASRISESSRPFATRFTLRAYQVLAAAGQLPQHPALAERVKSLGDAMGEDQWQDQASFLLAQGKVLLTDGQLAAAQALSTRLQALLAVRDPQRSRFLDAGLLQGLLAQAAGRHTQALELLSAAHATRQAQLGAEHPHTQLTAVHRARALWALGRRDEALAVIDRALPLLREAMGPDAPTCQRLAALRAELDRTEPDTPQARRKVELFL